VTHQFSTAAEFFGRAVLRGLDSTSLQKPVANWRHGMTTAANSDPCDLWTVMAWASSPRFPIRPAAGATWQCPNLSVRNPSARGGQLSTVDS
jgi:hypothetical protein